MANPALVASTQSDWKPTRSGQTWGTQDYPGHIADAWYRLQVDSGPGAAPAFLVPPVDDIYKPFWNGATIGEYSRMPRQPLLLNVHASVFALPADSAQRPSEAAPLTYWIGFHVLLIVLLGLELLYARTSHAPTQKKSIAATTLWISAALAFAIFIHHAMGGQRTSEYLAGYALEEALSIDNLFVFLLLFRLFKVDEPRQPRVLFWGVSGAIVMRGLFIAGGIGLLARFTWIGYLFGAILLIAAIRLVLPEKKEEKDRPPVWIKWISRIHPVSLRTDRFFTTEEGHFRITMLFLCLLSIEVADVVFALDSIPAVLSITRHPFLAYTSNIMAVMGLRSLYFLLIGLLAKLRFLHLGLAAVLAFAALKMLLAKWIELGPLTSLTVILILLALTTVLSVLFPIKTPASNYP